jgi:hypothetical protein
MKNRREFLSTGGRIAGIVLASGIKLARAMQAAQKLTAASQEVAFFFRAPVSGEGAQRFPVPL